ncbi:carbamoyl-phosphate synthase (glutamine-hydrolyzing) large subunit [Bacillus salitolerans]|uniref:Carbamoyl phosphate synthase large chain n=1 Tax=Bacillus salitolerans TaxID=1437434 RepID=A0ABW4LXK2_9BACI
MPLRKELKKVLVIGSGPIVIGQAAEFDYAGTQACLALKEEGIKVVLVNNNPATIMTDTQIADSVYMEPLTVPILEEVIKMEQPDGIIGTLGGQTGLNLTVQLFEQNILQTYGVELLGTSVDSIQQGEDREKFRQLMLEIGEPIPESSIIHTFEEGVQFVKEIGYPVIVRPAYTLGGAGGGFAYNDEDLEVVLKTGLAASPIQQVLLEKSIKGWKEVEYEVMRDDNDTCIIVCNMENMDPVGVHTGDSIVVAPSQTLTDVQYQMLRNASLKVIRALKIVGGCNIQFALDPLSNQYYIIEVNPRVSRSSALASKATGYPIARIAAKCAIGYHLDEIVNPITGSTFASFEPALDYIVVKLPRFPFDKFSEADRTLGTQMKATGEVMAIDRSFEGALNKAIRSLEMQANGLRIPSLQSIGDTELHELLVTPTDIRLFTLAEALWRGMTVQELNEKTSIDAWFLEKLLGLIDLEKELLTYSLHSLPIPLLQQAKRKNIGNARLASIFNVSEKEIRGKLKEYKLMPSYKLVDTCAAEFDAVTPYYYSTWQGMDEVEISNTPKLVVIGSGPIRIGQGVEFDYCSVHAALAVKKKGYEAIVINNNPETVSTDYSIANRLYFEPLATEDVLAVIDKEKPLGVLIQFGGQTAINLAHALQEEGVKVLGTSVESIDALEDRKQFYDVLARLQIPHIKGETVTHAEQLKETASKLGFPVLVRPSYVIGGQSMYIFHKEDELDHYVKRLTETPNDRIWPLLVDAYIPGLECEVDVISDGMDIVIPGIFEHIERAGVHSGDSVTIFPPVTLSVQTKETLVDYATRISTAMSVVGMMNVQFVISEGTVYVLEVNPRTSRTVPIMSKVTGIPMIEWATYAQLGVPLCELAKETGLLKEPTYYAVKVPIFSASKLKGVDHILGPEMKSTGEVLGLGITPKQALQKALPYESLDQEKSIFCSISDAMKHESLEVLKKLTQMSYNLIGTSGTVSFLKRYGIEATTVEKDERTLEKLWKNGEVGAVLNIPTQGRNNQKLGFFIRELSTRFQVPCFTSLDTFNVFLELEKEDGISVKSIQKYQHDQQKIMIQ